MRAPLCAALESLWLSVSLPVSRQNESNKLHLDNVIGFPPRRSVGRLRIAQVAPLFESVPPRFYGGTERVVAYLADALVALGHDVTLFASGDSMTTANLAPGRAQAISARSGAAQVRPRRAFRHAARRAVASGRVRHSAFPHRYPAFADVRGHCVAHGNDFARPPRP